jgi:hypothetical protein
MRLLLRRRSLGPGSGLDLTCTRRSGGGDFVLKISGALSHAGGSRTLAMIFASICSGSSSDWKTSSI